MNQGTYVCIGFAGGFFEYGWKRGNKFYHDPRFNRCRKTEVIDLLLQSEWIRFIEPCERKWPSELRAENLRVPFSALWRSL